MTHSRYDFTDIMRQHTSVRDFTDEPVSESDLRAIQEAVRAASSSCFLQVTSVIRVTDPAVKAQFAELSGGQKHIAIAPEFWVFCADYHRDQKLVPETDLGWAEQFMVGLTDSTIMAQSALTAAESLGLGGVYAGGIRNEIEKASELLGLPDNVIPVLGLAFGHPASKNGLKPRLPLSILFSENRYREPEETELENYNSLMHDYYASRPRNPKDTDWKQDIRKILLRERRPFILSFLQKKGFIRR